MILSNSEQEMLWVESWNDLYDLIEKHTVKHLLLEGYQEVDLDTAQGFIQNSAYESKRVSFKLELYKGVKTLLITVEEWKNI